MMQTIDEMRKYVTDNHADMLARQGPDEDLVFIMFMEGYLQGVQDVREDVLKHMRMEGESNEQSTNGKSK